MSIFPTSREGRWNLVVTTLCAYIIGVPLVGIFSRLVAAIAGWDQLGTAAFSARSVLQREEAHRYSVLGFGYVICLVALFLFLPALTDKRARRAALAIWALGLVFLAIFIYPMTQVAKTR
ncbi:MAG: hypothetical protein IH623_23220 [Verrucomicrobia bacterium]|nr:hypothetical protein [Verrucomicrobiota bacterium]